VVVSALLCLGAANIAARATWREVEDGVLWSARAEGVVAAEVAAGTPAEAVGIKSGDLLLAIDDRPVQDVADVVAVLHASPAGRTLRYTTLLLGTR
jgi:S1-C subfamily serine protease